MKLLTPFSLSVVALLTSWSHADLPQEFSGFRGSLSNGAVPAPASVKDWSAVNFKKEWQADTPGGFSSFTVAGSKAYTLVTREVEGNACETLLCMDAVKGKELWASPLSAISNYDKGGDAGAKDNKGGDGARSTPVVSAGKVYAYDSFMVAWCLDAATGKQLWKRDVIAEHSGENIKWQSAASPLVDGNAVFLAGGGAGQALLALNKDTGEVLWKAEDDKMTHATPVVVTLHGEKQIIFFTQKGLVAVTPGEGKVLWRAPHPYNVSTAASPVVWEDLVYCSSGYGVGASCFKIVKNGSAYEAQPHWRREKECINHWSTPVVKDGYLYGMFSFKEYGAGPLACVDMRTGKDVWKQPGFGPGQLILVGADVLMAMSDKGELVFAKASPDAYSELKREDLLEGKVWSYPVLAYDHVYIRSTKEGGCWALK